MTDSNPVPLALSVLGIVAAFCFAFALIWIFTVWLISLFSGWRKLAQRYPASLPPQGATHSGQTVLVGYSRYRKAITIVTNSTGMWMQPMWLFRAGHPPIFIPWSELSNPRQEEWRGQSLVRLDAGMPKVASVALPTGVLEAEPAAAMVGKAVPQF